MKKPQMTERHKSFQFRNPTYLRGLLTGGVITSLTFIYSELYRAKKEREQKLADEIKSSSHLIDEQSKELAARGREILKYGTPVYGKELRYYANHVLAYDQQKRIPSWVAEHITADRLKGPATRKNVEFRADPGVDQMFSAQNSDYKGSGWSRGHLNPAGDNKINQAAMKESFYLSNIVPQNFQNNAGFWNRLEMFCRDLTKTFTSVYIISGPLMMPEVSEEDGGKKFVRYQVIGENNVSVPSHLYKVIVVEDKRGQPFAMGTFIVPNKPIGYEHPLREYQVDLEDLEKIVGVKFVPNIQRDYIKNLCKATSCQLIGRNEFEVYFIGRKLESARTMHRVEKVWAELEEKKLTPDKYLIDLYAKKKQEISSLEDSES